MNLATLKGQVEVTLATFPEARNSDITLMIELWKRFYPTLIREEKFFSGGTHSVGDLYVKVTDLYDLPREDNIKRIRAKFQNDKKDPKYLPTSIEVAKQRGINEEIWYEAMKKPISQIDKI